MKAIAIQEKDLTLQWVGNPKKLVYVKVKKNRTQEAWVNGQFNRATINTITMLRIMKNGKSIDLPLFARKNEYRRSLQYEYNVPVFYIRTPITKEDYERALCK